MILTLTPPPEGVINGQPANIAMLGIKSKILSSLTIDVLTLSHLPPVLNPHPKGVIQGHPSNIVLFGIKLKVLIRTITTYHLNGSHLQS